MNFALPFGPRLTAKQKKTAKLMRTKHFGDDQTHSMGGGGGSGCGSVGRVVASDTRGFSVRIQSLESFLY